MSTTQDVSSVSVGACSILGTLFNLFAGPFSSPVHYVQRPYFLMPAA